MFKIILKKIKYKSTYFLCLFNNENSFKQHIISVVISIPITIRVSLQK